MAPSMCHYDVAGLCVAAAAKFKRRTHKTWMRATKARLLNTSVAVAVAVFVAVALGIINIFKQQRVKDSL